MATIADAERLNAAQRLRPLLAQAVRSLEEITDVLHVCKRAMRSSGAAVELVKALNDLDEIDKKLSPEERERNLRSAQRDAEIARREVSNGFSLLHRHSTVAVWAMLEALVRDVVVTWVENCPALLEREPFSKIKVPLAEFARLDEIDRCRYLVNACERDRSLEFAPGVERFEGLLRLIDLTGPIDDDVKRTLHELGQIRHVIMHRGARADRKLLNACPWLPLADREPINISEDAFEGYVAAVSKYITAIIWRVVSASGGGSSPLPSPGASEASGGGAS